MKKHLISLARCIRPFAGSTALFFTFLGPAIAQPGSGGPQPGGPGTNPTGVPLDGGVSLLLAAGIGLGLKRLRQHRMRSAPGSP